MRKAKNNGVAPKAKQKRITEKEFRSAVEQGEAFRDYLTGLMRSAEIGSRDGSCVCRLSCCQCGSC